MNKKPSLEKLICPICRGILIEPVTLPCKHELCLECFDGSMEMANLTCPMCRKRVGAWLRKEKKDGSLVNAKLWHYIQTNFAEYVAVKLNGEDDCLEEVLEGSGPAPVKLSAPGEIRKEFETSQARLDEEARAKQEAEELASAELLDQLKAEEDSFRKREEEDERLARELQTQMDLELQEVMKKSEEPKTQTGGGECKLENKENKLGTPVVRGPLDMFLSKVKPLQGNSRSNSPLVEDKEGLKPPRCDSITSEFPHFEFAPIHRVPQTPPKLSPDGAVLAVPLIRSTPVKHLQFEETCSPPLVRQLSTLHFDKRESTPSFKTHSSFSAFRGYQPKAMKRELGTVGGLAVQSKMRRMEQTSPDPFASDEEDQTDGEALNSPYLSVREQERQDALLARKLQDEEADAAKKPTYQLRSKRRSNQPTLRETLRRAAASGKTSS